MLLVYNPSRYIHPLAANTRIGSVCCQSEDEIFHHVLSSSEHLEMENFGGIWKTTHTDDSISSRYRDPRVSGSRYRCPTT